MPVQPEIKIKMNEAKIDLQDAVDREDWKAAGEIILDLEILQRSIDRIDEFEKREEEKKVS